MDEDRKPSKAQGLRQGGREGGREGGKQGGGRREHAHIVNSMFFFFILSSPFLLPFLFFPSKTYNPQNVISRKEQGREGGREGGRAARSHAS